VRFPVGAVLNCWGGGWWVFLVIATKVNLFYNGLFPNTRFTNLGQGPGLH
jgi:hypothetical protein